MKVFVVRDVRARLEVGVVDLADDLGPREVQEVRIAGDVARVHRRSARPGRPPRRAPAAG